MSVKPSAWRDVSPEDLAAKVTEAVMGRGREYWRHGQVHGRLLAGDRLAASVLGSIGWYVTSAILAHGEIRTECSCPYQGGICKHAAALVLAWCAEPASFLELDRHPLFGPAADPAALQRLGRELCLAAPAAAAALLKPDNAANEEAAAAVSLARDIFPRSRTETEAEQLGERLAWIGARLFQEVGRGEEEAVEAALSLAERLLDFWEASPAPPETVGQISAYLLGLAQSWPGGGLSRGDAWAKRRAALLRAGTSTFAGELALLCLAGEGEPEITDPEGLDVLRLLSGKAAPGHAGQASLQAVLSLLDAYERWERLPEAIALARAALAGRLEDERYVLRHRLAKYHKANGQWRQALAYLLANFRLRPDGDAWEQLRQAAEHAREWPRIKREIWPVVLSAKAGWELRLKAALAEEDAALLSDLAATCGADAPEAPGIWAALGLYEPEKALAGLFAGARAALQAGGPQARRLAAEYLRAAAKLCRRQGWEERWREMRAGLRDEFPPAGNWPELGALLRAED